LQAAEKLWNCYRSQTKASFSQRVRRLHEWAIEKSLPDVIKGPIEKLRKNLMLFRYYFENKTVVFSGA